MSTKAEKIVCEECVAVSDDPFNGLCVRCPFCKVSVNAIVTKTHITCPACKATVER